MTEQHVRNRTMPRSTVIPQLVYEDVGEAVRWLCDKFGFVERWHAGDHRAQLSFGCGTVVVTEPRTSNVLPGRQSVMVRVEDVDAHCALARDRGATILHEPQDFAYGERQYTAEDLAGHHWSFSQSIADVAPEEWGGTSGPALEGGCGASSNLGHADRARRGGCGRLVQGCAGRDRAVDLSGVAGLEVQGAPFFLHEANPHNPQEDAPGRIGMTSTRIEVFVDDPDEFVARAVAAGAVPGSEIEDHQVPWGTHRQGGFYDPFGHNWSVGDRSPLEPVDRGDRLERKRALAQRLPRAEHLERSSHAAIRVSSRLASAIQRAYSLRCVKASRSNAAWASGSAARPRASGSGISTSRGSVSSSIATSTLSPARPRRLPDLAVESDQELAAHARHGRAPRVAVHGRATGKRLAPSPIAATWSSSRTTAAAGHADQLGLQLEGAHRPRVWHQCGDKGPSARMTASVAVRPQHAGGPRGPA